MEQRHHHNQAFDFDLARFAVLGLSHRTASVTLRGTLSLDREAQLDMLRRAAWREVPYVMILSTCNRTEIYADCRYLPRLVEIWSCAVNTDIFRVKALYEYSGERAIEHLHSVISGADSQIPGDMQITHQVRSAFARSKENDLVVGPFEKIINNAIHCSKRVRSETRISAGVSSVPSAVALILKKTYNVPVQAPVCVVGLGKMGALACLNIQKLTRGDNITVINRTDAKAKVFARQNNLRYRPFTSLGHVVRHSSVVIVATASDSAIITGDLLSSDRDRLVIDLSMPANVESHVRHLPHIHYINIDDLSALARKHIGYRREQLDDVIQIVGEEVHTTLSWWQRRQLYTGRINETNFVTEQRRAS